MFNIFLRNSRSNDLFLGNVFLCASEHLPLLCDCHCDREALIWKQYIKLGILWGEEFFSHFIPVWPNLAFFLLIHTGMLKDQLS